MAAVDLLEARMLRLEGWVLPSLRMELREKLRWMAENPGNLRGLPFDETFVRLLDVLQHVSSGGELPVYQLRHHQLALSALAVAVAEVELREAKTLLAEMRN